MRQEAPIFLPLREPSDRALKTSFSLTLRTSAALAGVNKYRGTEEAGRAVAAAPPGWAAGQRLGGLAARPAPGRFAGPWPDRRRVAAAPANAAAFAFGEGFGHLEFDVVVEIAHRGHAGPLVNGLLDFRRQGDVFDDETGNLDAVFAGDGGVDDRQEGLRPVPRSARPRRARHLGQGDGFAEDADDARAHGVAEFVEAEMGVGAGDFLEKEFDINDMKIKMP